jgi:antitoxin component HigA of HigAB toxin-antitoxin module
LTLEMIRRLVDKLNLPAEVLIQPYELQGKAA